MLSQSTVIRNLLDNNNVEHADVSKLANIVRKHERASAAFLADLQAMNADEFKRSVVALAASYKADISKSGASFDLLIPLCDGLHKAILDLRNKAKQSVFQADKTREGFAIVKELANSIKVYDSMLSSIANLKANAANIDKALAQAA